MAWLLALPHSIKLHIDCKCSSSVSGGLPYAAAPVAILGSCGLSSQMKTSHSLSASALLPALIAAVARNGPDMSASTDNTTPVWPSSTCTAFAVYPTEWQQIGKVRDARLCSYCCA